MKIGFSQQIVEKYLDIKFHENPSSGKQVVPFGQTDMTKLIIAFRNFANAPKNELFFVTHVYELYYLAQVRYHLRRLLYDSDLQPLIAHADEYSEHPIPGLHLDSHAY
jgi:hypothetical protein